MPAFLDGSASTFEIERIKSPTTFELVPTPCKRAFLLVRYGVHGDSIWGCLRSKFASLSARKVRGAGNERMHRHFFCSGEHFDRAASCDRTYDLPKPYCSGTRQLSKFRHRLDNAQLVFSTTYKWSANCH
jgi:hypothetical protein